MTELPPDPVRLRAILAHLDKQIVDTETVGIYLRLQREGVLDALTRAEGQPPPQPQRHGMPSHAQTRTPKGAGGYLVERKGADEQQAFIHARDCTMIGGKGHSISGHEARVALTDTSFRACTWCRPDSELGMDLD
ncbi:DUF6233 domain-containing protein [Streptomyces phaeochromogenes]|uniref:DUF6233 domain-containing protein n=1 Tax=Streptomyces phaeochromogenes TaxID=1923 RepID=UPI0036B25C81